MGVERRIKSAKYREVLEDNPEECMRSNTGVMLTLPVQQLTSGMKTQPQRLQFTDTFHLLYSILIRFAKRIVINGLNSGVSSL